MVYVTPNVEHWLERQIAQWVHHEALLASSFCPVSYFDFHVTYPVKEQGVKL